MSTQPEALRLADALNRAAQQEAPDDDVICVARWFVKDSAAELRRLYVVNQELLSVLLEMIRLFPNEDELSLAGWDQSEINEACDSYKMACGAMAKHGGAS